MDERVNVKVLFFGKARELVKVSSSEIVLPINLSKEKIVLCLESKFPELCQLGGCYVLARNEEYLETIGTFNLSSGFYTLEIKILFPYCSKNSDFLKIVLKIWRYSQCSITIEIIEVSTNFSMLTKEHSPF